MQIVHYIHLNKYWYYWLDNSTQKRYFRKFKNLSDMHLVSEEIITEKEVKIILQKLFPDKEIVSLNSEYLISNSSKT
jgi:hypothetical protein